MWNFLAFPFYVPHRDIDDDDKGDDKVDDCSSDKSDDDEDSGDIHHQRLCKGLCLAIAYAANTGGIATLTGTPPNLVFEGQARK